MTNNNQIPIEVKKPVETVYELKEEYKIPSYEEFMKSYERGVNYDDLSSWDISETRGYGPCRHSLCGCHCPKNKCDCNNPETSIYREGDKKVGNASVSGGIGLGGHSISGDAEFSLYREARYDGEIKIGTVSTGIDMVDGGLGLHVKAGANVINFKSNGVEAKAGLNVDTGAGISSDGLELKLAGFGFTIGRKMEVSTIAGGVSVDCVIQ